MSRMFEEYFSHIQSDMVSICLEYASRKADKIYIYASREDEVLFVDFFYEINGMILEKDRLNAGLLPKEKEVFQYNISRDRQKACKDILLEDLEQIKSIYLKFRRDMPTQFKIIYDVKTNRFTSDLRYDLIYTNDLIKTSKNLQYEWFEEVKIKYSQVV